MCNLKDKIALITGSSSGIGKGTALEFAKLDAKLVITGRNLDALNVVQKLCQELSPSGYKPLIVVADLDKDENIVILMNKTIENYNGLDILINNAGISSKGLIEDTGLDQFDKLITTNLRSAYYLTHLAVPHLKKTHGSIINVSSIRSSKPIIGGAAYCISKAGMDQLTKCSSLELAKYGIRVNSVNPALIKTQISTRTGESDEDYEERLSKCKETYPLGRHGVPREVATAISFLADHDSSSFITGEILIIDDLSKDKIRVNCVNPGLIETNIHLMEGLPEAEYREYLSKSKDKYPIGKHGQPGDVVSAISFLADNDKSSFITGESLFIDGGRQHTLK
ncbi:hypothetical protein A3Q56_04430 [Intoshia linei]|uniref:3-oxoacyl-[acyl-carrier-protein] reductase FabG n=1 Tax=Intoshia linei TaxID=1819745 RepID=A0A177B1Z5_9BILA|nr:hypothetical protein A3Q56_04430 [Intoshia linei]